MADSAVTSEVRDSVLLYDGLCGFCDGAVQFILARDRAGSLKFAALQGAYARELLARHVELATIDSLILVLPASASAQASDTETVLVRSDAVVAIGKYLGGIWRLLSKLLQLMPSFVRDAAYDAVARRRFRIFGRRELCRIPSASERVRFID